MWTCPQYYQRSPFVQSIQERLEDYREGRLGVLGRLSSAEIVYFRVLLDETTRWRNYWDADLIPDPPKQPQ